MSRIASREPETLRLTARLSRSDLLWVANTAHGPGGHWHARPHEGEPDHDHLRSGEDAQRYLADHRVPVPEEPPDPRALAELATVREMVHGLLDDDDLAGTGAGRALLAGASYRLDPEGRLASTQAGWSGFCRDLLPVVIALRKDRGLLRRCANPACRLVFEDGSRNHIRRWCDTTGCGNRDRVRRARGRPVGQHERLSRALQSRVPRCAATSP